MSKFRQFRIANDAGRAYSLNGDSGIFLHEPTGLGMKEDLNTADLGYGFLYDLHNKYYPADPIAGDLLFINNDPYRLYREFIDFIIGSKELIFSYKPYGEDEFFCKGRFEYLTKTEIEKSGVLRVPISFIPFTPWYLPKEPALNIRDISGGEMAYTYKDSINEKAFIYDDELIYSSELIGAYSIQIMPIGHIEAAFTLEYQGEIENPIIVLSGVNTNSEYGRCEILGIMPGLKYSSIYKDSYIRDNNGHTLLNNVSPEKSPFFHIPLNEPSVLTLIADSEMTETAKIKIYYFYRSV